MIQPLPIALTTPYTFARGETLLEFINHIREKLVEVIDQDNANTEAYQQVIGQCNAALTQMQELVIEAQSNNDKASENLAQSVALLAQVQTLVSGLNNGTSVEQFNHLQSEIDSLSTELTSQSNEISGLKTRVSKLESKPNGVSVEQLNQYVTKTETAINIVDYGAVSGGTVDCTNAFRSAILAAGDGGHIRVPAGVYLITDTIELANQQWLEGDGQDAVVATGTLIRSTVVTGPSIALGHGCKVTDLALSQIATSHSGDIGISADSSSSFDIESLTISNFDMGLYAKAVYYGVASKLHTYACGQAVQLVNCYNFNFNQPRIYCGKNFGRGIALGDRSMANIYGGAIESYSIGVAMSSGSHLNANGVYWESSCPTGTGIDFMGYGAASVIAMGNQVYLHDHKAWVNAIYNGAGSRIIGIGNKFICRNVPTDSVPYAYAWNKASYQGGALRVILMGDDWSMVVPSTNAIYRVDTRAQGSSLILDPIYSGKGSILSSGLGDLGYTGDIDTGADIVAGINSVIVPGHGTNLPPMGGTKSTNVGAMYFDSGRGIPVFFNGTNWIDATGKVIASTIAAPSSPQPTVPTTPTTPTPTTPTPTTPTGLSYDYSVDNVPWAYNSPDDIVSSLPKTGVPVLTDYVNGSGNFYDDLTAMCNASNDRIVVKLPAGVYELPNFKPIGSSGEATYAFGFWHPKLQGIVGEGADNTIITIKPNCVSSAQLAEMSAMTTGPTGDVLQMSMMRIDGTATSPAILAGVTIRGTDQNPLNSIAFSGPKTGQPAPYHGILLFNYPGGPTSNVTHCRFQGAGSCLTSMPPFETGMLRTQYGVTHIDNCEFDGRLAPEVNSSQPTRSGVIMGNNETNHQISDSWLHHFNRSRYAMNGQNKATVGAYGVARCKFEQNSRNNSNGAGTNATLMGWEDSGDQIVVKDCILINDNPDTSGGTTAKMFQLTKIVRDPSGGKLTVSGITAKNTVWTQLDGFVTMGVSKSCQWYLDGLSNTISVSGVGGSMSALTFTSWPPSQAQLSSVGANPSKHYLVHLLS